MCTHHECDGRCVYMEDPEIRSVVNMWGECPLVTMESELSEPQQDGEVEAYGTCDCRRCRGARAVTQPVRLARFPAPRMRLFRDRYGNARPGDTTTGTTKNNHVYRIAFSILNDRALKTKIVQVFAQLKPASGTKWAIC